jgi:hypothetical protein
MKTICFALFLAANICSAASLDQSFGDISNTVLSLKGKRVQWNRGTPQVLYAARSVPSL